jgi:hypothetical protein
MQVSRRRLVLASSAVVAGVAGCLGSSGGDATETDADDTESASTTPGGALELDFGEGAEFTNDDGVRLQVAMADPRLVETAPVVRDTEIYVDSPESKPYFLFVRVRVANRGSSPIDLPRGLYFRADGEEVDRAVVRTQGKQYREFEELPSGESLEAVIAFPSPGPDTAEQGTVSLKFQALLESPPARWTFDFADVSRESTDLSNDGLGESYTVRAGDYAYEFTPTAAQVTDAYTYGDGAEHTAPAGSKFVLVEATAENVGEQPVTLPNPYGVRLEAGGSVARGTQYKDADERYQGQVDPYQPGERQSGVLLFEVPESASEYTLRLAIGNQTFATWPVEPSDG